MIDIKAYRPIKFLVGIETASGRLLYNTATGGIIHLKNGETLESVLPELIEMKYYVPIDFDEVEWVDQCRRDIKYVPFQKKFRNYTIFTTTECNARCFYCYEKGIPRHSMTSKVALDLSNFILANSIDDCIEIRWFGGEPLLNHQVIDIICNKLVAKGVRFRSKMITNGLLFTPQLVKIAKEDWNLKRVQITLDGTKDVYQRVKSFVSESGNEYDLVISNIRELSEAGINVLVRLNQDIYNTPNLISLVAELYNKFGSSGNVSVYNALLFEDEIEGLNGEVPSRFREYTKLRDFIIEKNLYPREPLRKGFAFHQCMADNDMSITISPDGKIGKCEHHPFEHTIGTIYNTDYDASMIDKWKEQCLPEEKCKNCPLYPLCYRIKLCPRESGYCAEYQYEARLQKIKQSLKNTYEEYSAKNKK